MKPAASTPDRSVYWQIRDEYGLTQGEWARAFGVSRPTISTWESQISSPSPAAQAAYRKLLEPVRTGDEEEITRLRRAVLDAADRANREVATLNGAASGNDLAKLLMIGVGAVAIGLLLAALFSDD